MVWKKVNNSDAGDSTHFGGDDMDKISETFNAGTQTDPINVKDENLYVVDPSDTSKKVRFDAGGVTSSTTRVVTLPDADITVASTTAASTSVAGLMSAADKTKLDAIEASATADQTDAEIRTAVENATDSNVFTDADHTKLNGIEANATADQTNAEIAAAVEAASDSNTFTDADHSKLDAIEANATADQTDAEIRAAVEAASDSNVFTDADHSKLNAIEASADVTDATNVNAAGAVMLSDTSTSGMGFVIDEDDMATDSDTKIPTQQSVVAYVASKIASSVTLKGNYDANADSPSLDDGSPISGILAGDHYVVSVAGTFFTEVLQAGDSIIAKQDSPTTLSHWITVNNNMVTPVVTAGIAADAVTGAKIADDSIDSEHIVDGSVDLAHMSANSVDSDQYVDGSVDNVHLATGIDATKIADGSVTSTEFQYINTLSSNAQTQIDGKSPLAGSSSIVTTGALDSGSITSGFGNINIGSSTITTTGAVATGAITAGGTITGNLTGNVTGNASGTAATVTGAAQTAITSVGTLTALAVDNITIDANKIEATNTNGNIQLDSNGTGVIEVLGNTNDGAVTLNCTANSHGQTIKSQPHSEAVTNTMLLPKGADSTLVSLVSEDTLTNKTLTSPQINDATLTYSINAQTGTTYTPVLADAGKIVTLNNGSAITVTIPPNSSVAYPVGSSLTFISIGAGLTTFAQGSGVTIASAGGTATAPIISAQHGSATCIKTATNTWQVIGAIE